MRAAFAALAGLLSGFAAPVLAGSEPVGTSAIPIPRSVLVTAVPQIRPAAEAVVTPAVFAGDEAGFQRWLAEFAPRAEAQGIRQTTLKGAFTGIHYDERVVARDRNQSEFSKQLWDYLDSAVSQDRIRNGRSALAQYADTLGQIEARYGVDREVVVAVWGLESAYGTFRGKDDIVQSLATLAYDGRRGSFFEEQLIAALVILQNGDVAPRAMTGSWAGAMGHTQFMPTSYLTHAVDFRGDGRRDIWSDDPTDALASTAAYLSHYGWHKGLPWGVEVQLPQGFDYTLAGAGPRPVEEWLTLGLRGFGGAPIPNFGAASVLLPAGANGPAFLVSGNFGVLKHYNSANSYAIAVGHLAQRIRGGPAIQAPWPRGDRSLAYDERKELQERLSAAGFSTKGVDGRIGPNTVEAIRGYQQAVGLTPDGYASFELLHHLR